VFEIQLIILGLSIVSEKEFLTQELTGLSPAEWAVPSIAMQQ
jgi:hypothetical protein